MLSIAEIQERLRGLGWSVGISSFQHPLGYRVWRLYAVRDEHQIIVRGPGVGRVWYYAHRLAEELEREG